MKLFDVDFSKKFIVLKVDGNEWIVQFDYSLWKGVQNVELLANGSRKAIEIKDAYPPIKRIIKELRKVYVPFWLRKVIKRQR